MTTKTKPTKRRPVKHTHAKSTRAPVNRLIASPLVTVDSVSAATNIPIRTLYMMARKKLIPFYRTGAHRFALRFNIEEVIESMRIAPQSEPQTTTGKAEG